MRPFSELTMRGKGLRLRTFAREVAIDDYGLHNPEVSLVSMHSFNVIFRVRAEGQRFAFRVGDACRIHAHGVEAIEAEWLADLHAQGFGVARNVPTDLTRRGGGATWVTRSDDSIAGARACSMFEWLDGRPLAEHAVDGVIDVERIVAAGQLFAELHDHASAFTPSGNLGPVRADRVVYFHEENRVLTYESPFGSLFVEAIDRVQEELDALWSSPPHAPHLLHGDFGINNVMVNRGRLQPIDFQDLQFGFDVQDAAISVADLGRRFPDAIEPFRRGYEQVRPWPDLSPDRQALFNAARSLNVMNLGLHLRKSGIGQFLDDHSQRVAAWMCGDDSRQL